MNFEIIPRSGERDLFPLSFGQERLWFVHELNPHGLSYNETGVFKLVGPLNTKALEDALNEIIRRHDILRTTFITIDGKSFQNIAHSITLNLPVADISNLPESTRRTEAFRIVDEEVDRTFDLARGPLTRYLLLHLSDEEYWLIVSLHHIVCDGLSIGLFLREAVNLYAAFSKGEPSPLPELPIQYADYAVWQHETMKGEKLEKLLSYWERQLSAPLSVLELPTDNSRLMALNYKRGNYRFELPANLYKDLRELKYREKVTLFMTLLAALDVLLFRYTGLDNIIVQSPISGRTHSKIRRLIGFFVNTLVLRTDLSGNPSFRELLSRVKNVCLEAYDHQELPYERLIREINPDRDPTRSPLGQIAFVLLKDMIEPTENSNGVTITPIRTESGTGEIDLTLFIWEGKAGLTGEVIYNANLFSEGTITLMIERFQILLEGIVENPEQRITDLPILTEREKHQLLVEWNNTKGDYPRERCIHELIEEQAEKTPQNIAVVFEGKQFTYKELNERANQLANFLTEQGVGPEALVGICVERSLDMIIGVLAIHKAGGAYVPLDPTHPKERLALIIDDTKVSVILTQSWLTDRLPENVVASSHDGIRGIICLDIDWGTISTKRKNNPKREVKPFNLAYVIYTSGTTGPAKGVMVEHRSIVNVVTSFVREYDLSMDDRILQQTSLSFDVSVNEIFPILSTGGAVVLLKSEEILDFEKLARLISESDVTIFGAVPSVLARFNSISQKLPKVRLILSGGEALSLSDVDNLLEYTRVTNGYGPTETTVCASSYDLVSEDTLNRVKIPIGKPLQNLQIYIVDQSLRCVPIGCPGELCIAGEGLARGYLNAPDLTSKKFVPNPFKPGERLYRTGDLARWLPDGIIEFLGRKDRQIKIRGFRIEPGEIEATIGQHPGIQEATVLDLDYAQGDRRLVAYLVPDMKRAFPIRQLLRYEQEGIIDESHMYELPNGMAICHQNKGETDFLYKEIFEYRSHIGPGITLHDGDCIFDVGANIGLFTLFVNQSCHEPIIYAFEPIPPIFEKLTINTALYGLNVKLFQCGLADREGQDEFLFFPEAGAMSGRFADRSVMMERQIEVQEAIREYLSRTVSGLNSASPTEDLLGELLPKQIKIERFSCPLKTISEVIREDKIECIDLLKIDVEKSEFDVLAGIQGEDWPKIKQIVIETQEDDGQLERLTNLLQSHGYDLEIQQNSFFRDSKIIITNLYALRRDQNRATSKKYNIQKNVGMETTWSSPTRLLSHVQQFIKDRLPNYMIPAHFVMLDSIPLTPNGKVDREALPQPDSVKFGLQEFYVAPRSLTERTLTDIWSQVLGIDKVGVYDNFFDLGGHSLLATQVVSRARDAFNVELPLRSLIEEPTVARLAEIIEEERKKGEKLKAPPIKPTPRDGELPLSFAQERLWFLDQFEPGSTAYNMPGALRVKGRVSLEVFELSFNEIIRRHELLRTTFKSVNGKPVQVIASELSLTLPVVDLSEFPAEERESRARRLAIEEAKKPFDLESSPLLRATVLRLGEEDHVGLFTMHHIISDGWSMGILIREVAAIYDAYSRGKPSPLPELPIQYADFAQWQRQWLQGEVLNSQLEYWKKKLGGLPHVLELPIDKPRPAIQTPRGATQSFALPRSLSDSLRELSKKENVTLFMTLLAGFNVFLSRYSGQADIGIGLPIAGRTHSDIETLIGFFVNSLVIRTDLSGNPSFSELLARVRETTLEAYEYQDLPFEKLVEELQPKRDPSRTPLVQVGFAFQNLPAHSLELNESGLILTPFEIESGIAKTDLTLYMSESDHGLSGSLEYNTDLFDHSTITRMIGNFQTLLESIVKDSDTRISDLNIMTEKEKNQLLVEWNNTRGDYPGERCIHELIEEQVEKTPENIAVVFEDQELTYRELNQRANRLAYYLQSLGVRAETLVGLCMDRSPEMIVGLLGILKAGGTYVPIDASHPAERLALIFDDSKLPILLTQNHLESKLFNRNTRSKAKAIKHIFCLDADRKITSKMPKKNPSANVSHDNLAFIFYTSGSTGKPKGIELEHRGICNFAEELSKNLEIAPNDRILQFTSPSFIVSIIEILAALSSGATLVMGSQKSLMPGTPLTRILFDNAISIAILPPSTISSLYTIDFPKLRILIATGESATSEFVTRWSSTRKCFNLYGTTETGVATLRKLNGQASDATLIGRPISNMQVYLLDDNLNPVPVGVRGELYIAGTGLARGYVNRPDLTSEKFIPNPFDHKEGSLMYRSGDFARYRPDGGLEFLGRLDNQVKIRGFRIELSEIDGLMLQHPNVRHSLAVVQDDYPEGKRIVVYFSPSRGKKIIVSEIREFLKQKLPYYMVPSKIVLLNQWPQTESGKIDRKKLPLPDKSRPELKEAYVAPSSITEEMLERIFAKVLGIDNVGINDNFFDLGGHSLKATQVISRIKDTFKIDLPQSAIYDMPTITRLAKLIGTYDIRENRPSLPPITPASKIRKVSKISENKFTHVDGQTDE